MKEQEKPVSFFVRKAKHWLPIILSHPYDLNLVLRQRLNLKPVICGDCARSSSTLRARMGASSASGLGT